MPKRPPVSKAEMEIARLVWKLGGATVRQVLERLPPGRNIEYKTVQTYLRRLEAKGYLRGKKKGRATFYGVRVRAERVIRETIHEFVKRLFDGDPLPLMEHLISDSGLTPEESDRLRELLDRHEEQRHERGK